MTAKNDITGDLIKTKACNDLYAEGWERIFNSYLTNEQESELGEDAKEKALDKMVQNAEELGLYEKDGK